MGSVAPVYRPRDAEHTVLHQVIAQQGARWRFIRRRGRATPRSRRRSRRSATGCEGCYLGYWIGAPYARQGHMTEALPLALDHAFRTLRLHRLEANILPQNRASIALVKRAGCRREGYSPGYLKIAGRWADHVRWALRVEDWRSAEISGARNRVRPPFPNEVRLLLGLIPYNLGNLLRRLVRPRQFRAGR